MGGPRIAPSASHPVPRGPSTGYWGGTALRPQSLVAAARPHLLHCFQMLRLKRVEISGFKSFYEKVDLAFPGSVTAVVGPNGCGKSNISDAVAWALGEQSARVLRGEKMDDVIFNGSAKRRPARHGRGHPDPRRLQRRQREGRRRRRASRGPARLPGRRGRVLPERQAGAPARHPGPAARDGPRRARVLGHRAGPHRPGPLDQAPGPAAPDRGGRRASPSTSSRSASPRASSRRRRAICCGFPTSSARSRRTSRR